MIKAKKEIKQVIGGSGGRDKIPRENTQREEASHADGEMWDTLASTQVRARAKSLGQEPVCTSLEGRGCLWVVGICRGLGGAGKAEPRAMQRGQVTDPGEDFRCHSARDGEYYHH